MAYEPHTLVTVGGTLTEINGQDEIWQIGIRGGNPITSFAPVAASQHTALGLAITGTAPTISTWFSDAHTGVHPACKLSFVKIVNVGADGKYASDPTNISFPAVAGGLGGNPAPSFITLAYSWRTDRPGRVARNGRVYPPNFGYSTVVGSAVVGNSGQDEALAAAAVLLSSLDKSGPEFRFQPYVVSSKGPFAPITGIRVGNVWDVQRRRKDAQPESYSTAPWASTP